MSRHLIIAMGTCAYMSIPARGPFDDLHCLITPVEHALSSLLVDEEVWDEIRVCDLGHLLAPSGGNFVAG